MAPALGAAAAVRARIAAAILPNDADTALGAYRLRARQRETLARLQRAIRAHGGALLADAPGSGKTVLALAVAAAYDDVLAIVPAALREQWARAAERAGVPLRIASHESLSRARPPATAQLLIVDEAHHFRNPSTQRYRALADLARGRKLLLLTATPVVNRVADRDALLSLFVGSGQVSDGSVQAAVILRRVERAGARSTAVPLPPLHHAADVPGLGEAIAALPPPFPAADGRAAVALVRVTLAMAWASSLAALDAVLRRRQQRGAALAARLADGQWPTRHALALWWHGEDATQLALPLATPLDRGAPSDALPTLRAHLAAVDALRAHIAPRVAADSAQRAAAVRQLLAAEFPRRVVVLAQHAETVRALYRALQGEPGVVAITGQRVMAAAGRWTRDEVIAALGPQRPPWSPTDPRGIRLLLATDILAEGVELQGCSTLVHADLAWTPARLEQRVGRVAREGQREEVHVTRFAVPADAERLLAIERRLLDKRHARRVALAPGAAAREVERRLANWRRVEPLPDAARVAIVASDCCAFVAAITRASDASAELVAGRHQLGRWRVSTAPRQVLDVLERCEDARPGWSPGRDRAHDRAAIAMARRVLQHWLRRRRARALMRGHETLPSHMLRAVRRRLDAWVTAQPLARRAHAAARCSLIFASLAAMRGRGAEHAIHEALAREDHAAFIAALESHAARHQTDGAADPACAPIRLEALLILRPTPPAPAPPSACSGTAAPR